MNNLEDRIRDWNKIISDTKSDVHTSNVKKRQLYSQVQLALLDVEEHYLTKNIEFDTNAKHIIDQLDKISIQLPLKPILGRPRFVLDDICRFICKYKSCHIDAWRLW